MHTNPSKIPHHTLRHLENYFPSLLTISANMKFLFSRRPLQLWTQRGTLGSFWTVISPCRCMSAPFVGQHIASCARYVKSCNRCSSMEHSSRRVWTSATIAASLTSYSGVCRPYKMLQHAWSLAPELGPKMWPHTLVLQQLYSGYQCNREWNLTSLYCKVLNNLSMADHVTALSRACLFQLCQLRLVRSSLTTESAKTLVHALVSSRLDYCNSLLYGVSDELLQKLQGHSECGRACGDGSQEVRSHHSSSARTPLVARPPTDQV